VLLRGRNGEQLRLRIRGYEFPDTPDDVWDSNWLLIAVDVRSAHGVWSHTRPCLLTWDVDSLVDWLEEASAGREPAELRFMEPDLAFVLTPPGNQGIRVFVGSRLLPGWNPEAVASDGLWLDLDVEPEDLRKAARELELDLGRHPPRTGRPRGE
jgi:hypothetical protein